uniref:non-specific serine/threonine protein kinase n=1 Tax=Noccaea caerulescens TaxID=107243 RepID=A0A1J3IXQ2_NOCCA
MWINGIFLAFLTLSLLLGQSCCETDTLLQGQYLKDGQELVSSFNIFKLKFFNFENSSNRYLGIWYNNLYLNDIQDRAVWIANRNNPIPGGPGSLTVDSLGILKILRGASSLLELSSTETTRNTTLKLLDSGNLQLQEMDPDGSVRRVLWQSFDYPTDTLLPGMKLGFNVKTGKRWELRSRLGGTLPASGSFVFGMDAHITNLLTILWRGNMYWASGLWFKGRFSLEAFSNYESLFYFVSNESEHYFMFSVDRPMMKQHFPR